MWSSRGGVDSEYTRVPGARRDARSNSFPYVTMQLTSFLIPLFALAAACGGDANPGGPAEPTIEEPQAATAHIATGKVVDSRGQPIAGARVTVVNSYFANTQITGTTGADGRYRISVPNGAWRTFAAVHKEFNGKTYILDLHPDKIDSFAGVDGAVRNFEWRLTGPAASGLGQDYYGGTVDFVLSSDFDLDEVVQRITDVEVTLTPVGPLIDGSVGRTITTRPAAGQGQVHDVPIGVYRITARHAPAAGGTTSRLVVRVDDADVEGAFVSELTSGLFPRGPGNWSFCENCLQVEVNIP